MDNQYPMNGGTPQYPTPPTEPDPTRPGENAVVVQPTEEGANNANNPNNNLENIQTQSVVESAREEAEHELEQVKAYNEAMMHQQRAQETATKAKRTSLTIFGVIVAIVLLGVVAWLVINAIVLAQNPVKPGERPGEEDPAQFAVIDGYKCTTANCAKVVDLPDGRIIIRDTDYYIYDLEEKEATMTSIENRDYHAITPFYWGDRLLAKLDPESDSSALYNITSNYAVTGYDYDTIYNDINDDVYKNQKHVLGNYIIVHGSGSYRFIDLSTGGEVVRAAEKVFTHGKYFFGFEVNDEIRAYTMSGTQIKAAKSGEKLYLKGDELVYLSEKDAFEVYNAAGEKQKKGGCYDVLRKISRKTLRATIEKDSSYYKVLK